MELSWNSSSPFSHVLLWLQDFQWDLSSNALSPDDVLSIQVKDYEKLGMNK